MRFLIFFVWLFSSGFGYEDCNKMQTAWGVWFLGSRYYTLLTLSVIFKWVLNVLICWGNAEAVARRSSVKKVFLEILQNSQENTCAIVSFLIKLQIEACNFIKKETLAQVFSSEFYEISKNTLSNRIPPVVAFVNDNVLPYSNDVDQDILQNPRPILGGSYKHCSYIRKSVQLTTPPL